MNCECEYSGTLLVKMCRDHKREYETAEWTA